MKEIEQMAGTVAGGKAAAKTNMERFGKDFYKVQGAKGGRATGPKGFGSNNVGADGMTGKERASVAGAFGGRISRRQPVEETTDCPTCGREVAYLKRHMERVHHEVA